MVGISSLMGFLPVHRSEYLSRIHSAVESLQLLDDNS